MSKLTEKYRAHRASVRRTRAIQQALARASSPAMRDELLTIVNRDF